MDIDIECDGSGNMHDLCDAHFSHKHCICGEPMTIFQYEGSGECSYCEFERLGLKVHRQQTGYRETHGFLDGPSISENIDEIPAWKIEISPMFSEEDIEQIEEINQ